VSVTVDQKYGDQIWVEVHNDTASDLTFRMFLVGRPEQTPWVPRYDSPCPRVSISPGNTELLQLTRSGAWRYVATSSAYDTPLDGMLGLRPFRNHVLRFRSSVEITAADVPETSALRGVTVEVVTGPRFTDERGESRGGEPRVVISTIAPESPAAKRGLHVGEWIPSYVLVLGFPEIAINTVADFYHAASVCVPFCGVQHKERDDLTPRKAGKRSVVGEQGGIAGFWATLTPANEVKQGATQSPPYIQPLPIFPSPALATPVQPSPSIEPAIANQPPTIGAPPTSNGGTDQSLQTQAAAATDACKARNMQGCTLLNQLQSQCASHCNLAVQHQINATANQFNKKPSVTDLVNQLQNVAGQFDEQDQCSKCRAAGLGR
jgi:hypothetical protein